MVWGFFLLRIKEEEGLVQTQLANKGTLVIILLFYIINMVYRVGFAMYQRSDRPLASPNTADNLLVNIMYIISMVTFLFALVFVMTLYCDLCGRQDLLWRNKMFVNLSFFFYLVVFALFIFDGFDIFEYSAGKVMFTYLFMNIFSFYLQYLYTPCDQVLEENQGVKVEMKTANKEKKQVEVVKEEENMDKFVISDEISVDLDGDYDVLI